MEYSKMSCETFINALASKEPVPGGGGASALVGAIGAALGRMVGSLTAGKKKHAAVEAEIQSLMGRADAASKSLLELMDRDAEAFLPLARAYGMPKSTDAELAAKAEAMESALAACCETPLAIMEQCCEGIELCQAFAEKGNPLAESDAGAGAAMCEAALRGASLNVFINTRSMADRAAAESYNARADALLCRGLLASGAVFERVEARLRQA